jgi:hypothetical protein
MVERYQRRTSDKKKEKTMKKHKREKEVVKAGVCRSDQLRAVD